MSEFVIALQITALSVCSLVYVMVWRTKRYE